VLRLRRRRDRIAKILVRRVSLLWVINGPDGPEIRLPLFTRNRTEVGRRAASEKGQNRK
jgi:hypothetical protein